MENVPVTLERKLKTYENSLAYAGYSFEELRSNVNEFFQREGSQFKIAGNITPNEISETIYFYFKKSENSVDIPVGNGVGYIPLSMEKYGFNGETSKLNSQVIEGLHMNNDSIKRYQSLISRQEASLSEILETVGSVVNSSMRYDFDSFIEKEKSRGNYYDLDELRLTYVPSGKEISQGACFDAGKQIRTLLHSLGMDSKYKIKHVASSKDGVNHDTTLVFNEDSGAWGVINSKSPTKEFNFATRGQLEELGSPYYKSK